MDYNTPENNRIIGKLVEREVYYCQSCLVDELLKQDEDMELHEQITNLYNYTVDLSDGEFIGNEGAKQRVVDARQLSIDHIEEEIEDTIEDEDKDHPAEPSVTRLERQLKTLERDIDELRQAESEPQEIFEWWLVSDYLANKLEALGHPILREHSCTWWGRCTTGQQISADYALGKIAEDMEILEGQAHSWVDRGIV